MQAMRSSGTPCSTSGRLTMGVEEEFILVDRRSRAPVGRGPLVIAAAARRLGALVQPEFFTAQVEVCTRPTASAADLGANLADLRRELGKAADGEQCLLLASGTPVIPPEHPLTITPDDRYQRIATRFPSAVGARDQLVCGCHVHIGVEDRAQALELSNRIRPWLPVLQALAANSPSTAAGTPGTRAGGRSSTLAGPRWGPPPSWTKGPTSASPRPS